jgi:putative membrane protein
MHTYAYLPALNAALNGTSAVLVATGIVLIKRGQRTAHKRAMIAAFITSSLFLISYLYYHAHVGSVRFQGQGWSRGVYFTILLTHTVLAAVIVPFVLVTLTRGLRGRYDKHKRSARWTYPMWLYVSITGVIIYVMLYHLFAA